MSIFDELSDETRKLLWGLAAKDQGNITTAQDDTPMSVFNEDALRRATALIREQDDRPSEIWAYPDTKMEKLGMDVGKSYPMETPDKTKVLVISESALRAIEKRATSDSSLGISSPMPSFIGLPIRRMGLDANPSAVHPPNK